MLDMSGSQTPTLDVASRKPTRITAPESGPHEGSGPGALFVSGDPGASSHSPASLRRSPEPPDRPGGDRTPLPAPRKPLSAAYRWNRWCQGVLREAGFYP